MPFNSLLKLLIKPLNSLLKGWAGEVQGTLAKKIFLDSDAYIDINNVTIPISNGTTQIDHVIVSRYGVFVVETKNMDGWIFGDEKSAQWTQCIFGKKYKFQNPLRQNYRHTTALSDFLGISHDKFLSVVMFWGSVSSRPPFPQTLWRKAIRLTSRAILLCCYPIKKCRQSLRQSRMVCCPRAGQRNGSTSPLSKTASLVAPYVQSAVALSYSELRNLVPASVRNFMGAQSTRLADMSPNLKRTPNE